MDAELIFIIGIVLVVLLGPWALVWRGAVVRKRQRDEEQEQWRSALARISALERTVQALRVQRAGATAEEAAGKAERADSEASVTPPLRASSTAPPVTQTQPAFGEPTRTAEPVLQGQTPDSSSIPQRLIPPTIKPISVLEPSFGATKSMPSLTDRVKKSLDVEEVLGTNWLNKLGIVILVLGVAFFLAYQLKTLGPAGKVLVGLLSGGALLGAGVWFERGDRYRALARAGIGGGWAILFFTTYAMYHVAAAKILSSQITDLVLMLAVAAAMVAHTLRYRSQAVTALAFLLAFLTITISHSDVYSLSAGAVLAAGLVVIVGRMQWFEMEVLGIAASYFNHYLWLRHIIEPMHGKRHPFPEFAASAGILSLYWLVYRVSYVWRKPTDGKQERISSAAALLNTTLLLALFKYQSAHPKWAFWALLAIGTIETLLGQLPITRRRRSAVVVLSTLGVALLVAAFPFRYSGTRLSVLWLLQAEVLLLIGVWTKEVVFRRLGMLAAAVTCGQMISVEAAQIYGRRMDGADLRPDFALAMVFVVAAAVFYANAHWILRRWSQVFSHEFDRRVMQRLSYAGAGMLFIAAWIAFPEAWTAVAWCAVGLALAVCARWLSLGDVAYQGMLLAAASAVRVLAINLGDTGKFHSVSLRMITIVLVSALLYVTIRWRWAGEGGLTLGDRILSFEQLTFAGYTWAASFLLALVAWYELRAVAVADAWVVGGLMLLELGLTWKKPSLRTQGYVAFVASFLRMFFVNLNAAGNPGQVSPRFYTVVPLGLAFFYAYWRLQESREDLLNLERRFAADEVCCWLGTLTFAALVRFETGADWVAAGWAALTFALMAVAQRSGKRIFLEQGSFLALGVLFRTVLHNFYERSYFPPPQWESRWITAGAAIALLGAALPFAFLLRQREGKTARGGLAAAVQLALSRPEQFLFFIAVGLLTGLLGVEMRHGMVTLAWGIEGLLLFLLALRIGERSFRLTGLGLLLLCAGKILVVDVWRLDPRDRYLSFIVLGAALLLVSFLYTRNREALRQYL
jgi:uncharacterized membrane protein